VAGSATIEWEEFLTEGILKEQPFREKMQHIDWTQYANKNVVIRGCSDTHIPTWAFMAISAHLAPHARHILFGEHRRAVSIYKR